MKKILFKYKYFLFLFFLVFCVYNFMIVEKSFLKISILITVPIFYICVMQTINNWEKLGHPKLLDWFKLASFFVIVIPFYKQINMFNNSHFVIVYNDTPVETSNVLIAQLVVLIGVVFLSIGSYFSNLNFTKYNRPKKDFNIRGYYKFVFFAFLFLLVKIYLNLINLTGFGSDGGSDSFGLLTQIINSVSNIFFVVISFFKFKKEYKNINIIFYVFLFINLFLGLLSGMKENVIVPLIFVLVPYLVNGNKIKLIHIITPIFLFVFLYPLNNNYREVISIYNNKVVALTIAMDKTLKEFGNKQSEDTDLLSRYEGLEVLMHGISIEEEWNHFKYLNRYVYLPVSWILPRVLLPQKPLNDNGGKLYEIVRGKGSTGVSITPSTYGWAYLEGGYIPVILSFLLYGFIISLFEKRLLLTNLNDIVIYTILLASMVKTESDIYFRINSILQLLFLLFIFKKLFLTKIKNVN